MYCLRCGMQNDDNAINCKNCQEPLDNNRYYSYKYSNNNNKDSKSTYSKNMTHEEYANYSYKYSNGKDPVPIQNQHDDQYNYSYNYSSNNVISGDEKYIANYVGKNYLNIKNSKFSFATLIFGPIYFIYRKLFYYALLWFVALAAIIYYIPEYAETIYWCINAFLATKFSVIYLEKVEQRVDKIKHESLDLTSTEMLDKCTKVGGTIKSLPKLIPIIMIIGFFILMGVSVYNEVKDIDFTTINNNNEPDKQISSTYIKDLTYTLPQGFDVTYSSVRSKTYYYDQNNDYCRIGLHTNNYVSHYENNDEFLKQNIYIENFPIINKQNINNIEWSTITYNPNNTSIYNHYAYIYNSTGYLINFDIVTDTTGACHEKYQEFINSLKFQ